jgi:Effector Associated Constant Component 1
VPSGSTYAIEGTGLSADDLRSLRLWMLDVCGLRGPIDLRPAAARPGEMGSVTDALVVAAGSGGALTSLAGALVSWLRHRTSDVTIKVVRPDGSVLEFEGRRVRGVGAEQVGAIVGGLAAQMAVPPESHDRA